MGRGRARQTERERERERKRDHPPPPVLPPPACKGRVSLPSLSVSFVRAPFLPPSHPSSLSLCERKDRILTFSISASLALPLTHSLSPSHSLSLSPSLARSVFAVSLFLAPPLSLTHFLSLSRARALTRSLSLSLPMSGSLCLSLFLSLPLSRLTYERRPVKNHGPNCTIINHHCFRAGYLSNAGLNHGSNPNGTSCIQIPKTLTVAPQSYTLWGTVFWGWRFQKRSLTRSLNPQPSPQTSNP